MKRHASFAVPFHPRDFGAAQASAAIDADALCAKPHGRLHGTLHHAAESHAALELLRNVFGNKLGVDFRLADFNNVQMHFVVGEALHVILQFLDVRALLPDDDAGPRGMDCNAALLVRPLDDYARHACLLQPLVQVFADLDVFLQQPAVVLLAGVPARIPCPVYAEPQARGINLLTHQTDSSAAAAAPRVPRFFAFSSSRSCATTIVTCENGFSILAPRPRARA